MKFVDLIKNTLVTSSILMLFRISSVIVTVLLINNLNIESFADFQLIKVAIGYLLIAMEFGFFHYGNTLFNTELYKFRSIIFNFIKLRILVFLAAFPLIILYFYLNHFEYETILLSSIACFILIFSYEGALVTINKNW